MERKSFLKTAAATAVGTTMFPTIVPASVLGKNAPSNKIQIGQIGVGEIALGHDMVETMHYDQARFVAVYEQFGAGMITGWGQHHFDSTA